MVLEKIYPLQVFRWVKEIPENMPQDNYKQKDEGDGSIIVVIATDAPLLAHQMKRLARRVPDGVVK